MLCRHCGCEFSPPFKKGARPQFCSTECRTIHTLSYRQTWRVRNKERTRQYRKQHIDRVRQWNREFYARHRERRKALRKAQYRHDPRRALDSIRRYARENKERIKAIGRKSRQSRRFRIRNQFLEVVDPLKVFERDHGICGICKGAVDAQSEWHVDHIIPLARGGIHAYANVQLAHGRCNRAKGARL